MNESGERVRNHPACAALDDEYIAIKCIKCNLCISLQNASFYWLLSYFLSVLAENYYKPTIEITDYIESKFNWWKHFSNADV